MRIILLVFFILLTSCATKSGKDFYSSCLETGMDEIICRDGMNKINRTITSRAVKDVGKTLQKLGRSLNQNKNRSTTILCTTRKFKTIDRTTCTQM